MFPHFVHVDLLLVGIITEHVYGRRGGGGGGGGEGVDSGGCQQGSQVWEINAKEKVVSKPAKTHLNV